MAKRTSRKPRNVKLDAEPADELRTPPVETSLDEILGQERAVETLDKALTSSRVHHAWIFHGPVGVGKFTTAMAFAAVLLDPGSGPDLAGRIRPDPDSRAQQLIRAGSHPDLHVIVKELARFSSDPSVRSSKQTTIAKDVIDTRLIQPAYRRANMPGGLASKVFIVDEAELLDRSTSNAVSQNALLKTLEEPPEGTVVILVTSNEDRLLPTIRSRSQRVTFAPLADEAMHAWMDRAGIDPGPDAGWLLSYAGGSPGRLVEAIDTGLLEWHKALAPLLARADRGEYAHELGPTMHALVDEWARAWAEEDDRRSKDVANRKATARLLAMVADHARRRLAEPDTAPRALGMIDAIAEAERRLASNVMLQLVLEGLAADLPAAGRRA